MTMIFNELPEFAKIFKRMSKKCKSLPDDLEEFKRVITVMPLWNRKHFRVVTKNDPCTVVKARLFCRYLKGSSLRIIYAFHSNDLRVDFIEIYFKGDKENENRERIKAYLNNL